MKHFGDITNLSGDALPKVHCIIGGSPCQDLSIAGKRAGLDGERSGLFMEQVRIVKEMRSSDKASGRTGVDVRPRYMVWENVPGALSSNKGEDFRTVLEEICKIEDQTIVIPRPPKGKWNTSGCIMGDGYSVAWRVMDAQYYGVPQRRRRIALVADFGGQSAPEILFEPESLSGHSAESGEEGKRAAEGTERSIGNAVTLRIRGGKEGGGKGPLIQTEPSGTLATHNDQTLFADLKNGNIGLIASTVTSNTGTSAGHTGPSVLENAIVQNRETGAGRAICIQGNCIDRSDTAGCNGKGWRYDQCYTLNTIDRPAVCFASQSHAEFKESDTSGCLRAKQRGIGGGVDLVHERKAYSFDSLASNSMKSSNPHSGCREVEVAKTLDTTNPDPSKNQGGICIVEVRPIENHPADSRVKMGEETDPVQTLSGRMGTGGATSR